MALFIGFHCQTSFAQSRPAYDAIRGLANTVEFHASGVPVHTTANQSRQSPMLVRIAETRPASGDDVVYRAEFIGLVAGQYDLREYLERQDGSPLNLPPIPVSVQSKLEASHGTDLFSSPHIPLLGTIHYRLMIWLLGIAWLSVPVIYFIVRIARRQPPPTPVVIPPPPTLADQLRPLAEAAIQRSLSLAERSKLELLMYLYWREQLHLTGPQADVVPQLRRDERAGGLLRAVEEWLHSGRSSSTRAEANLASLLDPYRRAPAISEMAGNAIQEASR